MQFIDLKAQYSSLKDEIDDAIENVLTHGQFIQGREVKLFEKQLGAYIGRKHCVTCANGTDALQIVYMAYKIGLGDAVFCPDITFFASVEPAIMLGASPVLCDIDADTYNICPDSLERQIKAVLAEGKLNPRAVVAVDFLGNSANYEKLETICEKYNLLLIEDAAQATGAEYCGKKCGAFGEVATTSFFPAKPLGCYGDGGAIFTDDDEMAAVFRSICVHGKGPGGKYDNIRVGMNSRLDTLQAAIMLPKLAALEKYEIRNRQVIAQRYNELLGQAFTTPFIPEVSISAYAQYVVLAQNTQTRDWIVSHLAQKGIPCMVYYPKPLHMLPIFADMKMYSESFINASGYCERTLSLPMHPYLSTEEQEQIAAAVLEAI